MCDVMRGGREIFVLNKKSDSNSACDSTFSDSTTSFMVLDHNIVLSNDKEDGYILKACGGEGLFSAMVLPYHFEPVWAEEAVVACGEMASASSMPTNQQLL